MLLLGSTLGALGLAPLGRAQGPVTEFNNLSGGRTVALAVSPANGNVVFAAAESGGLFKSLDDGMSWSHVNSFKPNRVWDVAFHPTNANVLIATVVVDTRGAAGIGIWRSADLGATWQKPPGADLPDCPRSPGQPSFPAYGRGIHFGPGSNVFVGTDCGLSISHDSGVSWAHFVPSTFAPGGPQSPSIWDVVAQPGVGYPANPNSVLVDICGEAGPLHSGNNAVSFGALPSVFFYPTGLCSIEASPYEPYVLFATSHGVAMWESDDAGASWYFLETTGGPGNRRAWVLSQPTFEAFHSHWDLYFHKGADTFRQHCVNVGQGPTGTLGSPPNVRGIDERCPVLAETGPGCSNAIDDDGDGMVNEGCPAVGTAEPTIAAQPFCKGDTDDDGDGFVNDGCDTMEFVPYGAHHDHMDMAFRTSGPARGCPYLDANDGGVYRSSDCGRTWRPSLKGLGALQIFDLAGTVHPTHTDLYIGTMDNELWASPNGGLTWPANISSEGLNLQAPQSAAGHGQIVTGTACAPCSTFAETDHFGGAFAWSDAPNAIGPPYLIGGGSAGPPRWAQVGAGKLYIGNGTTNAWTPRLTLPALATPALYIAGSAADPTIYVITDKGGGRAGLSKITNTNSATATITPADNGLGNLYFYVPGENPFTFPRVFGVDSTHPDRIIAADHATDQMKVSSNGGASWSVDPALTNLVKDGGALEFHSHFHGMQAHAIAFDPSNGNRILVGTEAAGVIATLNAGKNWFRIPGSRPITAATDFFYDTLRQVAFVSTYGRGLWRLDLAKIEPPQCANFRQEIAEAKAEIADLQADLKHAAPGQKAAIIRQIRTWQARLAALRHAATSLGCPL